MTQSNEQGGERLREELFRILVTQGQDQAGIAMGRRSADGSLYKSRTDEHLELIMQLILADRKQHELDAKKARVEQSKSLCGCPMCLHHSEAYALKAERERIGK